MSGDRLALLLTAVGLVASIVVGYYFYRRGMKERRPVYVAAGNTVVRADTSREIEVRFKGADVPVVTRTVVVFWNAGREPIRRDDVVENHPVSIRLTEGATILDVQVIAATRPEIDFRCEVDGVASTVYLAFSHLNQGDGAAVEVLHTGSHITRGVVVDGAIVGVSRPPTRIRTPLEDDPAGPWIALVLGGVAALAVAFGMLPSAKTAGGRLMALLLVVLIASLSVAMAVDSWRKDWRRLPRALREDLGGP